MSEIQSQAPVAYRSAVTAADVLAAPTTSALSAVAGGSLPDGTYKAIVVGINAYGRTVGSTIRNVAISGSNNTVRIPITQLTGATAYDIYCSTDADPKWVGRITEAQRATGIKLTAVATTGAGGTANAVDVEVAGTGLQSGTTAATSTAYSVPASPVSCVGYRYCGFDISASRTGDVAALAATVVPFFYNSRTSTYHAGTPVTLTFGGASGVYTPLKQRLLIEVRGNEAVALVFETISGTGASFDVDAVLS
jgi:hypothetical protein